MTIYQLKKKLKILQEYKRELKLGKVYYNRDWLVLMGLEDIAENEEHYIKLLRRAERAANEVIKQEDL